MHNRFIQQHISFVKPTTDSEGDVCVGDVLAFAYRMYNDPNTGKTKKLPHLEIYFGRINSIVALDPKYKKDTKMQVFPCQMTSRLWDELLMFLIVDHTLCLLSPYVHPISP